MGNFVYRVLTVKNITAILSLSFVWKGATSLLDFPPVYISLDVSRCHVI